jgi:hypothetical protein
MATNLVLPNILEFTVYLNRLVVKIGLQETVKLLFAALTKTSADKNSNQLSFFAIFQAMYVCDIHVEDWIT